EGSEGTWPRRTTRPRASDGPVERAFPSDPFAKHSHFAWHQAGFRARSISPDPVEIRHQPPNTSRGCHPPNSLRALASIAYNTRPFTTGRSLTPGLSYGFYGPRQDTPVLQLLTRILGSRNERLVRSFGRDVRAAATFEPAVQALSDEAL